MPTNLLAVSFCLEEHLWNRCSCHVPLRYVPFLLDFKVTKHCLSFSKTRTSDNVCSAARKPNCHWIGRRWITSTSGISARWKWWELEILRWLERDAYDDIILAKWLSDYVTSFMRGQVGTVNAQMYFSCLAECINCHWDHHVTNARTQETAGNWDPQSTAPWEPRIWQFG